MHEPNHDPASRTFTFEDLWRDLLRSADLAPDLPLWAFGGPKEPPADARQRLGWKGPRHA